MPSTRARTWATRKGEVRPGSSVVTGTACLCTATTVTSGGTPGASQARQLGVFLRSADIDALAELRIVELVRGVAVLRDLGQLARWQRPAAVARGALRRAKRLFGEPRLREDIFGIARFLSLECGAPREDDDGGDDCCCLRLPHN